MPTLRWQMSWPGPELPASRYWQAAVWGLHHLVFTLTLPVLQDVNSMRQAVETYAADFKSEQEKVVRADTANQLSNICCTWV